MWASCSDAEAPYLFRLKVLQETEHATGWVWKLSERFLQRTATTEAHNNFAWETGISGTHRVCVKHPYNSSLKVARAALHHLSKDARSMQETFIVLYKLFLCFSSHDEQLKQDGWGLRQTFLSVHVKPNSNWKLAMNISTQRKIVRNVSAGKWKIIEIYK